MMEALEILNGMSKGEWAIGKAYGAVVTDDGEGFNPITGHCEIEHYGGYLIGESIIKDADKAAIVSAVNATYGKGYDPSKMEEMYKAMQEFCDRVDRGEVRSNYTYAKFKTILQSAKL